MNTRETDVPLKVRLLDSIPARLGLGVLTLTLLAATLVLVVVARQETQRFTEQRIGEARKLAASVASDLSSRMLAGGGATVWASVSTAATGYADAIGAAAIQVLTAEGTVKASSEPAAMGRRIWMRANPDCPGCDSVGGEGLPASATVSTPRGAHLLRVVNAIPVSNACLQCHADKKQPQSYVLIDFDLAPLERANRERQTAILGMGLAASLVLVALVTLLFRRMVMRPVDRLTQAMARIARGDLSARSPVLGRNELGLVARHFNHMAGRIEQQLARIEAANTESELLYTLVVEASKNLETGEVAVGVARVLLQKLRLRHAAFFLETADGGWTCASGGTIRDERVTSGEGALDALLSTGGTQLRSQLDGMPTHIVANACRARKLMMARNAGGLTFALPVVAETRLVGLLIGVDIPANIRVGEELLENLGVHLTLASINSRNYTGAITDGLTRLKNKRYGLVRLEDAVYAAKRYKSGLGLLMCDIDHFKQVNDTYGHPAGDTVLKEVSRRIAACVRKADIALRYGGEEFMLILPQTEAPALAAIGEKVRQAVAATPVGLGATGVSLPLTISVGVSAFHADTDSGETLIARADAALYRAKEGGRDRVELDA